MMGKAKNSGRKDFTAPSQGGEEEEEETEDATKLENAVYRKSWYLRR
jgi:hypothetical protein